jgi:23S rRNA pseudouridine1911/1915/1917 synthase
LDLKTVEELFKDIKQGSTQIFEIVPTKGNLDILFENHDLLVINKQAGIAMHPGAGSKKIPTMANYVRFYLEGKGEYDETVENAGVVHRLDRCVAGVTIWAKNSKIQKEMRNLFKAHLITKVYRANIDRINGTKDLLSEIEEGKWHLVEGFIRRDASNRYRRQFTLNKSDNTCKEASMYIIYKNNEIYISLITGRNHQIRAALRFFGYFVKGDTLYSKPFSKLSAIPNEIELYSIFLRINDGQYKNNPWAIGLSEYEQNIIVNLPNKAVVC